MLNSNNFKTITDLRSHTMEVLQRVADTNSVIYIIARSKPQAVLISIDTYGKLLKLKKENRQLKELISKRGILETSE